MKAQRRPAVTSPSTSAAAKVFWCNFLSPRPRGCGVWGSDPNPVLRAGERGPGSFRPRPCLGRAWPLFGAAMLALWAFTSAAPARAGVLYDLATDWSTTPNPFGAWSLYKSEEALFTIYQPGYGWADQPYPQTAHVPVWSLGEGGTNILVHSAELDRTGSDVTKARWTSPINGTATIQGGIWMTRDQGRRVGWQLRKNGVVLSAGEVYSGDPYDAANPFRFELGSGGAAALTQAVQAGDYLELALISLSENGNLGENVGLVFRVELTAAGCQPPPPGLVAWWRGEGDGQDVTGNHPATLQNNAGFTNGLVGQAFRVSAATTDHLRVANHAALNPTNITIAAWVKPFSYPTAGSTIVRKQDSDTSITYLLMLGDGATAGRPHFNCGIAAPQPVGPVPVPLNQWSHIVGTYDGTEARVYVNGVLADARPVSGPMPAGTHDLFIGRIETNPNRNFDGLIDEVAIWNRGLSSNEVAALYAVGSAGMCPPSAVPPAVTRQPSNQVVLAGWDVTFEVAATGALPLGYQWFFNGGPLAGATGAVLSLPQVTTNQAGNYFVVVSNLWGAATSQVATLTVMACGDTLPNLVAWWPADGDANDRAGTHHGAFRNGATLAAGKVGAAFSLDGVDDYIDTGRWTPGSTWTVAAWVKPSAAPAGRRAILGGAADCADWGIVMDEGVFGLLSKPPSGCTFTVSSGVQAVPGTWYFVVGTCDGSTGRVYVDGQLRASSAVAAGYVGTSAGTRLGNEVWCNCNHFPGLIDEPMVFNRALSAEEVAFLFASATCAPQRPLIFQPPASQVVLATRDVTLQVGAAGDEPLGYQWFFNSGPLAGATNATLSLPLVTTNQAGAYFVVVSNLVGAVTSQVAVLTVLPDTVGPVVTNFVPLGAVNTNVSRLLVQFNERIHVDSFTPADVSVVTPGGALNSSTFTIQPVAPADGTAFEVLIPSQSLEGDYTVRIGPFITDLAGNLMVGGSLFESQAFTSQPGHWTQLGHAAWNSGGFVRLTPATTWRRGSLVLTQALPAGPFVLSFDFRMSNGGGASDEDGPGADGIALNILPHAPGTPFFYGEGGNAPAFHLFLDSYGHPVDNPGDTNGDHIAIGWTGTNGSVNKAIQVKVPQRFIDTGLWHAEVEFDGAGLLTAHITSPAGAVTHVSQIIPAAAIPPQFYFGFGAYTGGGYANQDVDNIVIHQLTAGGGHLATFTIDKTGPSITSVSPSGVVSNTITFFDVSLDSAYAPGSLSTADVTISGPGAPAVQSVSSLGATSFRVMLAGPLPQGDFTITIGPDITDQAGNPMAGPFNANLTVFLPDLTVSSITAPASALAGQPLNLSWTVTNLGPGNVIAAWKTRVQLATNAAGEGAVTLATFTATNLLAASTALSQTGLVILPATVAGQRWLVVTADAEDEVLENAETNNAVVRAAPVTLLAPDLALAGLSAPASAQFGQSIAVTWAVTNVGTAPASASWSDRVYLSAASNSLAGAVPLTTVAADAGPLPAGGGYRRTVNVTVPLTADSAPGTLWLVAVADYQDAQAEATEANNLRSVPLALTLPPLPDLAVARVEAPAQAAPNQAFNVIWAVTNLGSVAATGVWSETLLLTNTAGGLQTLATVAFTNALPAGGSVTRTQAVVLPINGPAGDTRLLVQVDSRGEVIEAVEGNNVSGATNLTVVPLVLTLQLPVAQVSEATSTPILQGTVTRNGSRAGALTVTLTNSDPTELSVPASVVIPAGAASAVFDFRVLPDSTVDGPQTVTVGARAEGYQPGQAALVVLDADLPRLTLVLPTDDVPEGLSVQATVARDLVTSNDLVVTLASSSPGQLSAPASVTIPAHSNAVTFTVTAVDDTLIELIASYTLTATAPGYLTAVGNVTVLDNDVPGVVVTLELPAVSENAGPQATVGTVTRTPVSTRAVVVELTSTNPAAATVPATVTIPANMASATFTVAAVDNALLDGPRTTLIGGYVLASGSGSRVRSVTPALLTVTDDDGAALGLTISPNVAREGRSHAATLTVTRNTPATNALVVSLVSSDTTEATVPATVTIPAGQSSAMAAVTSIADGINDGNQSVLITASASGFAPATATIVITDSDLPDLFVASLSAPEWAETESYVNVTYRIANQGSVASTNAFLTRVFLSGDNTVGNDTLAGQFRFTGALPPGQFFEQTLPVRLPQAAGDYWLIVQTDAEDALAEMLEDNNTSISRTPISARASYGAWVQTDLEVALAGTPVPMSGRATNQLGGAAAYKLVNVHIRVRGTERIISALTDANGNYSVTFQPLPNEAGDYEIFATHPGVATGTAQDAFVLLGMKPEPETTYVRVIEGQSASGSIGLRNLSDQALTGLSLTVEAQPAGLNLTASLSTNTLAGSALATLNYTVGAPTSTGSGVVELHVTTTEGAEATVWLVVTVDALRPVLVSNPAELVAGMARGRQSVVEFEVRNDGGLDTGPITVSLPAADWLQLASTNPLPSLPPGATNRVTLLLTPPADLPLGPYSGSLALNCTGAGLAVPFSFRALSEARGDLLVTAEDEFTYFAVGAPPLVGANVTVRDAYNGMVLTNGLTGTNGQFFVPGLPEGYYRVEVTAAAHQGYDATHLILAGQKNAITAFLHRQSVQYFWTVVPTEIEDRTKIVLETTFETYVPMPVVTIEPASIDLSEIQGDVAQVNLKVSNQGLIAAENVQLDVPTDPYWRFTPLVTELGTLAARSSLTIPLTIERVRPRNAPVVHAAGIPADCWKFGKVSGWYFCNGWVRTEAHYCILDNRPECFERAQHAPPPPPQPKGDWDLPGVNVGNPWDLRVFLPPYFVNAPKEVCLECPKVFVSRLTECDSFWSDKIFEYAGPGPGVSSEGYASSVGGGGGSSGGGAAGGAYLWFMDGCVQRSHAQAAGLHRPITLAGPSTTDPVLPMRCWMPALECQEGWMGSPPDEAGTRIAPVARAIAPMRQWPGLFSGGETGPRVQTASGLPSASQSYVALLPEWLKRRAPLTEKVAQRFDRVLATINLWRVVFGDEAWITAMLEDGDCAWFVCKLVPSIATNSDQGVRVSPAEQQSLFEPPVLPCMNYLNVSNFLARWNRTADYAAAGIFELEQVPANQSTDFIIRSAWSNAVVAVVEAEVASQAEGFNNSLESAVAAWDEFYQSIATSDVFGGGGNSPASSSPRLHELSSAGASDGGVCARVRLQIEQEAVITRDAFKATLEVLNNSDSALREVSVMLTAKDSAGRDVTDLFGIRPPTLENWSAVDGTGLISEQSTGRATWILIPTQDAAPEAPVQYFIGGTLRYLQDDLQVTVPLTPVPITVYPNPRLFVKYFHQRDVYSDDPFTEAIEPSIPFNLAVMIENRGKGDARNMRITSAQPKIIENEKGLLIDFQIIATEVAGQNLVPSLTANFGNVGAGQIAIGRWLLTSTLQGLFTDYKASFEHIDGLGNKKLSLIEEVTIHEMIRLVQAGGDFEDGRPDFLVNDLPDPEDRPDMLYLSDGSTNLVEVVETATVDAPPGAGHLQVHLTAPMPAGWAYLRVPEPGNGQFLLRRVVRSDGAEISVGTNAWTTDRTFIGLGRRPIRENILHLLDHNSPGSYTLHYEPLPAPDTTAPESQVAALPAASREAFPVQWGGADDSGSVAGYDVFVSVNGGAFVPWLQRTRLTSAVFQGEFGSQYAFYSRAVDAAGNREEAPVTPDAQTTVSLVNHAPVITPPGDQVINEGAEFNLTPTVSDADEPADRLTFSLLAAPPGLTMDALTGQMRWLTGEAHGPSTNLITWTVRDDGLPPRAATNSFRLVVNEVNSAPVMSPIKDATVLEGRWLIVTNAASDADLPAQQLTWSLVNAPAGATIDPASGLLRWRPTETQGGVTHAITVAVRDNGPGQLFATQTFLVTVEDVLSDFAVSVGTTNLLAGEVGFVPLGLVAGVPLTNVSFILTADEAVLTNLVLQPRAPELSASSLERVAANLYRLTFTTQPGNPLRGTQEVARLSFIAPPREDSAIVQLGPGEVLGIGADGTVYDNGTGEQGRVFVIGRQPIVADLERSAGNAALTLYGQPGQTYLIESTPALGGTAWHREIRLVLSNTWMRVSLPVAADAMGFYRAVEASDAGSLTARLEPGRLILEWRVARPNCSVEETSHLGAPSGWTVVTNATVELTNGLARVHLLPTSGTRFYRLRCD